MSPGDRLGTAREKMETWIRGGVELAWLIHPADKSVYVYRPGQNEAELCTGEPGYNLVRHRSKWKHQVIQD